MTKEEIMKSLHFDRVYVSYNPYFFNNKFEEKGTIVLLKLEKDISLELQDLEEICYQCLETFVIEGLVRLLLFTFDKDDTIIDYNIASSKYRVTRSDFLKYEQIIQETIE